MTSEKEAIVGRWHRHTDRATIAQENLEKLAQWVSQYETANGDVNIKRSDLVNWLLNDRSPELLPREVKILVSQFHDPVKSLQNQLREARQARLLKKDLD